MNDRVQTSMWLRGDLYHQMKMSGMNLTQFINTSLEAYFNSSATDELKREIKERKIELAALETSLKTKEAEENKVDVVKNQKDGLISSLKEKYDKYRRANNSHESNIFWLEGPKYKDYRIGLKKTPEQLLDMLEAMK